MLWIFIGFNADPDADPGPVFFISMRIRIRIRIQEAKPVQIQADPDPDLDPASQTLESQKVTWKYTTRSKTYLRRYKSLFEDRKLGLFVNFRQFPCSWVRIPIHDSQMNADPGGPDPDPQHWKIPSKACEGWKGWIFREHYSQFPWKKYKKSLNQSLCNLRFFRRKFHDCSK